ncbi:MAG: pitrilysin family protein [Candidatus Pacebacteria bacterium]|nr:pitrilysin family protein [Candidatus Paceibacterota bacterium]
MFKKTVLKNGLKIITCPMKNTHSVTVLILVKAGTKYETKKENGISHFLEHMYFKGTKKRKSALDVSKEIDGVGGIINAFTSKDYTGYFVKVDYSHFNLALDLVSDIFLNSTLPDEEINKERGVIIEEIKMFEDTPMHYIEWVWEELLYGDQPAGWKITGERKNVLKIQREDFLNYIKNYYVSQNTVVCVAGKIDNKKTLSMIGDCFSDISQKTQKKKKSVREFQTSPRKLFFKKNTKQTHLALGVRAFNIFDKRRFALQVLSVILGGNMSSRMFQELREKRGLAYYIHTSVELNPDTGYLVTYAGIDHKNIEKATFLITQEYKKIKKGNLTEKEIKMAKEYIKGLFGLSLEESDNIASFYASQALLERNIISPEEKIRAIDKVNKRDILNVAKYIFTPSRLNLAVISPKKKKIQNFTL